MYDDGVGLVFDCKSEKLPRCRYRGDDFLDLRAALDLKAVGTVIGCSLGFEQLVEFGNQSQEIHAPMVAQPIGAPARSAVK